MLLRQQQLQAHTLAARRSFEGDMVEHLRKFSPRHCAVIKEEGVREVVRLGLDRAGSFGFTNRGPVRLFIELMFMFGSEFATDPQHAWAAPSLEETMPGDQMYRAQLLYDASLKYLDAVSGPANRYAIAALRRTYLEIKDPVPYELGPEQFARTVTSLLQRIYPEKAKYLKAQGLQLILSLGLSLAARECVTRPRAKAMFIFLVFVLGRGCADDPLYPWIRSALADPRIENPDARAARIEARAATYLHHVIEYVRET